MALTRTLIEKLFAPHATKNFESFFTHVSPTVDWIVPPGDGHVLNPVAGHYHSAKDFAKAFSPLGKRMQSSGIALHVVEVTIDSEERRAAVELSANEIQKNGKPFKVYTIQYFGINKFLVLLFCFLRIRTLGYVNSTTTALKSLLYVPTLTLISL